MPHDTPLISTIVVGLVLALVLAAIAHRLRISPLVGYLLAGILVGPFTPGFVADQKLATELAEIGVILLMFGVGLHFSPKDLMSVRAIAIPGAFAQITVATLLGVALSWALGWGIGAGIVFGLALSVASTVVLLRALQERRLVETYRGKIAVGWLIVEDVAMVLALVLLPALAGVLKDTGAAISWPELATVIAITLGKVAAFVLLVLVVGGRVIPAVLHYMAHTGSRELFRLSVLAIALGVAFGAAKLFDVSFALGAFFAGMLLAGTELSQRATQEVLPLRDAFAVLFFVSVGMLFDPSIVVRDFGPVIATVAIIVIGKSAAAYAIVRMFGHPVGTALTISASLAQIGEFSFILVGLGVALDLLPTEGRDLVLAGALISIMLNPVLFAGLDRYLAWTQAKTDAQQARDDAQAKADAASEASTVTRDPIVPTAMQDHVVLVGFGRVGGMVAEAARAGGHRLVIIDTARTRLETVRGETIDVIPGQATDPDVLAAANLAQARCLIVAIPDAYEAGQVVQQAHRFNLRLPIIARAGTPAEGEHLKGFGATTIIEAQEQVGLALIAALPKPPAPDLPPIAAA